MDAHELTAGYALDALDADEARALRGASRLVRTLPGRATGLLAGLRLAGACGGRSTAARALRGRILEQARSERPNVVPLRRRFTLPVLLPATAVAAAAAIVIGIWAAGLSNQLDDARNELAVLGDPNAQVFETSKGEANLVVAANGKAALVVGQLAPAPEGKDYEIWVFENGVPQRAGLFEEEGVALLTRPVEPGQMVAVTVEPDGGLDAPSGAPIFTASSA